MKFLVFSDNHRNREYLQEMLKNHKNIEVVISLGDSEMSEAELTVLGVFGVRGNYPFEPRFPYELNLEFGGVRFLFVHGHLYNVKNTLSNLVDKAIALDVDIVFYGHTHVAKISDHEGVILVNPGALSSSRSAYPPSYALIETKEQEVVIKIIDSRSESTILEKSINYPKRRS
ncbi:MAG: metallophosphoesterase [Candidatus Izemoplasmatales bacterium]